MTIQPVGGDVVPEFNLGHRMALALEHAGIGVAEMGDYLGVHSQSVTRWTRGHNPPKRQTLLLWALATGVSLHWLETGEAPADVPTGANVRQQGLEPRTRCFGVIAPDLRVLTLAHSVKPGLTVDRPAPAPTARHLAAVV